eukprot:TRINITY_DN9246_c0_g1_i1.p1 TRINITY_DN9246_c0_g1~~TRINITY_DN9246_c0_g1_i1.p1  ORF type:complete len:179 (-),score=49.01 TRINITY_DN9246_c0_g1_i1:153-689(-)
MRSFSEKHVVLIASLFGLTICDNVHHSTLQAPSAGSAPVAPYYPEYPDYGYPPSGAGFSSELDRQGLEAVLGAPVVITAFAAALFGGLLSPLISSGLNRMSEFEIEWPEFKQKVETGTKKKTKSTKNKSKLGSKARELLQEFSWIEALDSVNNLIGNMRTKRSAPKFDKIFVSCIRSN